MLSLLIVEDERWEREGLVEFWDWREFGIGAVETAVDGIEGLEKALALAPDIIITDIRMPGMDGIEMSKQIRDKLPDVRIIVLTGYDDFGFAREAIRFGAADYVLKPIEEDELRQIVAKTAEECRQLNLKRVQAESSFEERKGTADWVKALLNGKGAPETIRQALAITEEFTACAVIVIAQEQPQTEDWAVSIRRPCFVLPCEELPGAHVLLVPLRESEAVDPILRQVEEAAAAEVSRDKNADMASAVTISGGVAETLTRVANRYVDVIRTARFAVFYGRSGIISGTEEAQARRDFAPRAADYARTCQELAREIRVQAAALRLEKVEELTAELFALFQAEPGAGQELPATMLNALLAELTLLSGEHELPEEVRPHRLMVYPRLRLIEQAVRGFMSGWMNRMEEKRLNKDEFVVRKVIQAVEARYGSTDLSLTLLAETVFLSANHLGVVFKKAMGKTVHEFITEYRMGKAEEQLRQSKRKVASIAAEVGIPNTSYFCSLFKQAYGMTPGEYQELMQRR